MKNEKQCGRVISEAIQAVRHFVAETTSSVPTDEEIADALKRYFVLNEIKEHILMARGDR